MIEEFFKDVSYWVRVCFWRLAALFIKPLRLDRFLWKKYILDKRISTEWQEALDEVKPHAPFFEAVAYRPKYDAPFDQEKLFLDAAIAVANFHYFRPNLEAYRRSVERIGSYLNYVAISNSYAVEQSDIWVEYLHAKATVEMIFDHPAIAASTNSKARQSYSQKPEQTKKPGHLLDEITYEHCIICCRMESLTTDENYLLTAIDSQLQKLCDDLIDLSQTGGIKPDDLKLNTVSFYIAMLRCKAQMYTKEPNIDVLRENIEKAKKFKEYISGSDLEKFDFKTYEVVVPLYRAILCMWENQDSKCNQDFKSKQDRLKDTEELYNTFMQAYKNRSSSHFCLMRIPDKVFMDLESYVNKPRAFSNQPLETLKQRKNIEFRSWIVMLSILAILAPFLINYFIPLRQIGSGFTTEKGMWYLSLGLTTTFTCLIILWMKSSAERFYRGLLDPSSLSLSDTIYGLYRKGAIGLIGIAFIEKIK